MKQVYHSNATTNVRLRHEINKSTLSNLALVHYNLYRRHGSLRKELKVKTPFNAVEKWYQLEPDIFTDNPEIFKRKLLILNQSN